MGYTTTFEGAFKLNKPLTQEQADYLHAFNETRRIKRNTSLLLDVKDELREAVGLPLGVEGEFFVGYPKNFGQTNTQDVVNYNATPSTQPSLWCGWCPTDNKDGICCDGAEKFYSYVEWLQYLINNFLKPWGYELNGIVEYQGEEDDDHGYLIVRGNQVFHQQKIDFVLT